MDDITNISSIHLDIAQRKYDLAETIYNKARIGFDAGKVDKRDYDLAYLNVEEAFADLKAARYRHVICRGDRE